MKVYAYSEARRWFARILDEARAGGEIRIKRRDGSEFSLRPVTASESPLDVPGIATGISRSEILGAIREGRDRDHNVGAT